MDSNKTGLLIKRLREDKGLGKKELAALVGCGEYDFTVWESGYTLPDAKYLLMLAKHLGVTVEEILSGEINGGSVSEITPQEIKENAQQSRVVEENKIFEEYKENNEQNKIIVNAEKKNQGKLSPYNGEKGKENNIYNNACSVNGNKTFAVKSIHKKYSFKDAYTQVLNNADNADNTDNGVSDNSGSEETSRNGFSAAERKLGYIAGIIFIVIIIISLISQSAQYANRDRTITLDNYKNHISVDIDIVNNVNQSFNTEFVVTITALKALSDLNITISIDYNRTNGPATKTVVVSDVNLPKNGKTKQTVTAEDFFYYNYGYTVVSVSGDLY